MASDYRSPTSWRWDQTPELCYSFGYDYHELQDKFEVHAFDLEDIAEDGIFSQLMFHAAEVVNFSNQFDMECHEVSDKLGLEYFWYSCHRHEVNIKLRIGSMEYWHQYPEVKHKLKSRWHSCWNEDLEVKELRDYGIPWQRPYCSWIQILLPVRVLWVDITTTPTGSRTPNPLRVKAFTCFGLAIGFNVFWAIGDALSSKTMNNATTWEP